MSIENTHAYKYGELTVAASTLARTIKEDWGSKDFQKAFILNQADRVLELLEAQRNRGNE
jgi:hypothetical protein